MAHVVAADFNPPMNHEGFFIEFRRNGTYK